MVDAYQRLVYGRLRPQDEDKCGILWTIMNQPKARVSRSIHSHWFDKRSSLMQLRRNASQSDSSILTDPILAEAFIRLTVHFPHRRYGVQFAESRAARQVGPCVISQGLYEYK